MESKTLVDNNGNTGCANYTNNSQMPEERGKSFGDYWRMVKNYWVSIFVCTSLGITSGLGCNFLIKTPKYENQGKAIIMAINDSSLSITSAAAEAANISLSLTLLASVNNFMEDAPVLSKVMTYINIYGKYYFELNDIKDVVSVAPQTYTSTSKSLYIVVTATSKDKNLSTQLVAYVLNDSVSVVNNSSDYSLFKDVIMITSLATIENITNSSLSGATIVSIAALIGIFIGIIYAIIKELTELKIIGMITDYSNMVFTNEENPANNKKENK